MIEKSSLCEGDAYMDALDAELDEIIAAGAASKEQAAVADAQLQEAPPRSFTDAQYDNVLKACHRLRGARVKAISSEAGVPPRIAGAILKGLVADGYAIGRKKGASNVFYLTSKGEEILPPPEELDARVPDNLKPRILDGRGDPADRVEAINHMYAAADAAGIGILRWKWSGDWQLAYVSPLQRDYFLMAISPLNRFASITFRNPEAATTQSETASVEYQWPDPSFYAYLKERIAAIQSAQAKIKEKEQKYYRYSFYDSSSNRNVKSKDDMLKVVEGTQGTGMTYYSRYGFAYRGAKRTKVSYDDFRKLCGRSMVDITVDYNNMEAEVNEFSENDMY